MDPTKEKQTYFKNSTHGPCRVNKKGLIVSDSECMTIGLKRLKRVLEFTFQLEIFF